MLFLTFVCAAALHAATIEDQHSLLRDRLESGQIEREEYYLYLAQSVLEPDALPDHVSVKVTEPVRSGTPILKEIRRNWHTFSPELKSRMEPLINRPLTEFRYLSLDGHFWVHFDTAAGMETPPVPLDDADSSGYPDFVETIALYADSAWRHIVGTLGYDAPPSDGSLGGDSIYDIYFHQSQLYGITWGDTPYTEQCADGFTSHIRLHRNFLSFADNDDPEGNQKGSMKVAVTHEFFHAVQFVYDAYVSPWWGEAVSVWMEEEVFPEVNDNYNYFDEFWPVPQKSLIDGDDIDHAYGSFVWPVYLEENYGTEFIYDIVTTTCFGPSPITAIQLELQTRGSSLNNEFGKFLFWNYATGSRATGEQYDDAAEYPEVAITRTHSSIPALGQAGSDPPSVMGSNYIRFDNDSLYDGILQFKLDSVEAGQWAVASVAVDSNGGLVFDLDPYLVGTSTRFYVPYIDRYEHAVFIPHIRGTSPNGPYAYNYSISYRRVGDANDSGGIDVDDIIFVIAHVFQGGPASSPAEAMDAECSGDVSIDDIVYLIDYVFGSGPPPCGLGFE